MLTVARIHLLTALLFVAGLLDAGASIPKNRVGDFFDRTPVLTPPASLQVAELHLENPSLYDWNASGSTLWTSFDPDGLYETTITDAQAASVPNSAPWINGRVNKVIQQGYALGQKGLQARGYKDINDFVHRNLTTPAGDVFGNDTKMVRDLKRENPGAVLPGSLKGSRYEGNVLRAEFKDGDANVEFSLGPNVPLAGGINLNGQAVGTDKLDHMFHDGYSLTQTLPDSASARKVSEANESGLLGIMGSGVYSNGDIEANMFGYDFYSNLKKSFEEGKPYNFDIGAYDSKKLNENANRNDYSPKVKPLVEANEKKQDEQKDKK